jgi:uncharacterized protein YbjT (DUF2867 family)
VTDRSTDVPTVAVAGATSPLATYLPEVLGDEYRLVGLTRRPEEVADQRPAEQWAEWRRCDLFSSTETEHALRDVDIVIYLAHSARPSARLTQASATDLDILCADNLAFAAATHDVDQIVHVSTILHETDPHGRAPETDLLSQTLGSTDVPVTGLDTDLVLSTRGTTTTVLRRLVERLPVLFCPRWTEIPLRIVEAHDLAQDIESVLGDESTFGHTRAVAPSERATYRQLLETTADILDRKRWFVSVPLFAIFISAALTATVTGQPSRLMRRFVKQLEDLDATADSQPRPDPPSPALEALLERALGEVQTAGNLPATTHETRFPRTVRSVQRLPAPRGRDAKWAVDEYLRWLPARLGPFLSGAVDDQRTIRFFFPLISRPALVLEYVPEASRSERQLFRIGGGFLVSADNDGEFEFRLVFDGEALMTAIHDFRPALPWVIYVATQALVHLSVMRRFGHHITSVNEGHKALTDQS